MQNAECNYKLHLFGEVGYKCNPSFFLHTQEHNGKMRNAEKSDFSFCLCCFFALTPYFVILIHLSKLEDIITFEILHTKF